MKRIGIGILILCSTCLVFLHTVGTQAEDGEILRWNDPKLYDGSLAGERVTVEGTIVRPSNATGKAC